MGHGPCMLRKATLLNGSTLFVLWQTVGVRGSFYATPMCGETDTKFPELVIVVMSWLRDIRGSVLSRFNASFHVLRSGECGGRRK